MEKKLKVVGVSHQTAPVTIREQIFLNEKELEKLLPMFKAYFQLEELLVLSTCNRTELYYCSEEDLSKKLIHALCLEKGISNPSAFFPYFKSELDPDRAVLQLFEVANGLRSQVLGDLQISHQTKKAYRLSNEFKLAGPYLHRLMHTIFHTHKRVQQQTAFRDGAASISYAAVELAKELSILLEKPAILVLGTGEMGTDILRTLYNANFAELTVSNRTAAKAEALAKEVNAAFIPLEEVLQNLHRYDIILSSLSVEKPFLAVDNWPLKGSAVSRYLIDVSVPRSLSPELNNFPEAILYDIDELRERTSETLVRREAAIPTVKKIIAEEMRNFEEWSTSLQLSPVIHRMKEALEQIRQEELARFLKNAAPKEQELIDKVTASIMNKIMKLPVVQLKAACKRGEQESLIDVLNELFDLEKREIVG